MNKLCLLPLLVVPACAAPGENARLMQAARDHDQAVCTGRGNRVGSENYLRCMVALGHNNGYLVAEAADGNAVFALAGNAGIPGNPTGGMYLHGHSDSPR